MTIRKLNYTNRQKILRKDIQIWIRKAEHYYFDIEMSLNDYDLPNDAVVFLEAYQQTSYMRFNLGVIGAIEIPENRMLSDFYTTEGITFRLKIVTNDLPKGLLIAEATRIRPIQFENANEHKLSLITVQKDNNMNNEIWKVEFDVDNVFLKINARTGDWQGLVKNKAFISLVYPSILRSILFHILFIDEQVEFDDIADWRARWMMFSKGLPGVGELPSTEDEKIEWINTVVDSFCHHQAIFNSFQSFWKCED